MPYDASNRKDIRRAEKAARLAEIDRLDYLKAAMTTRQGRLWFHDLLEFCHLFNDPFTGDSLAEAYRKGERNVGLRLFADIIAHCPDDYVQMMKEANARRVEQSIAADRDSDPISVGEFPRSPDSGWDDQGSESESAEVGAYGE